MTWNILASEWIDQPDYPNTKKKLFNRATRFKKILKIIKKVNADILLLQEVMPLEYNLLKKKLEKNYTSSPLIPIKWEYQPPRSKTSKSGNVTFIKINLPNITHKPLNFGIYTENPTLSIFNIHLDDLSVQSRSKQLKSIKDLLYLKKQSIVGGDFNQIYRANSRIYNQPKFTTHNLNCSTYYIEKKMNIDNIMTRGFESDKYIQCIEIPTTIDNGIETYGSDHLPVIINLSPIKW